MATECPGCREPLDVQSSHGWPYVRTAVALHLESCPVLRCSAQQRDHCAELIADRVAPADGVAPDGPFRCPLNLCERG